MARQEIILGTPPQGLGGDPPRTASMKINAMTAELYAATGELVKVASPTDITAGRLVTPGHGGMGGSRAIDKQPTDSADTLPAINARFIFGNGGSALPYPYVYIDQLASGDGAWTRQIAYAVNSAGVWERYFIAGAAAGTPWSPVYNGVNALEDPASGGLMSSALVGGYLVNKYANGEVNIRGAAPTTAVLAANSVSTAVTVNLPIALVNGAVGYKFSSATLVQALVSYDQYGVVSETLPSPSVLSVLIRNGATAQAFVMTINVWGRWK